MSYWEPGDASDAPKPRGEVLGIRPTDEEWERIKRGLGIKVEPGDGQ